jgi:hypothetical protein
VNLGTPAKAAIVLGAVHFLLVGVPFIAAGGGGEALLYIVFVDFPLFWLAESLFSGLLFNSVAFNFWMFPVIGTIMYAAIGYVLGLLFVRRPR